MKILRLDLRAFGPFTDVSLDFSTGSEGLHLVYGPNEAGKSSALRALGQLLYGIPTNSPDNFLHPYPKLRVGALLVRRDGSRLELLRRKGAKATLLAPDDTTPLDESELRSFLGGCDRAQFDTMFGIDHPALIAGGQDIIRGHGEVGHVLFAAGAGIADLRTVRTNLEKEADELFSSRGSRPAVNQSLAALKEARQKIRDTQLPSAEWVRHEKALRDATDRLAARETDLQGLSRQRARLERIARALPVIGRRRQIGEELARLGDVPILPEDFSEKRRDAVARLDMAGKARQEASEEIQRIEQEMASLVVPDSVLAQAEAIEETYRGLSVFRKAQADLPSLVTKRGQLEKAAAAILRELRADLTLDAAPALRLARRQQVEIQNLGNRKEALEKQLGQARAEIGDVQRRLAEATDQLAQLSPPCDASPLCDAIRQAQGQGDLDHQSATMRAELRELEQQAEVDRNRLGIWEGTLDALEKLPLPAAETIDRFDREMQEARAAVERHQKDLDKAQAAVADLDRRIRQLRLEGEVPSEDDLADARRVRDAGWRLVLGRWLQGQADPDVLRQFVERFEGAGDLAAAYEQAVRRADDLADRLRREANRVATQATLQAELLARQQQIHDLQEPLSEARQNVCRIDNAWADCWRPPGIVPLPPREMRSWLQRQQLLVQQVQAIRSRHAAIVQVDGRIAVHRGQLQRSLAVHHGADGVSAKEDDESLAALLARCEATRVAIEAAADARRQLTRDMAKLNQSLVAAQAKAELAETELADWHSHWTAAIEPLGLRGDAAPAVVNEMVAQTNELFVRLQEAESYAERIEAIGADSRRFREEVERLTRAVDPDRGDAPVRIEEAVEQMYGRLRRATADRKNLALLTTQHGQQQKKHQDAHQAVEQMTALLGAFCQEAGCSSPSELPTAERASVAAATLRRQLHDCDEELLRLSAGATIESLVAEAETVHADELPAQLQKLDEQLAELQRERGVLQEAIGGEKAVLATMDSSAAAADAAEDVQNLLARIEPDVQQYLRLRLASVVLREGIERYRKKNEGPVLARASELFRRLTLGSFDGLRIDFDERGEQVLAGIRPGGETLLPAAMSDGASDQLYLALRLASLETWLQRNEPMPLVVDDILVGFDNARATATLEILAELSRQTQVIFFTHHAHLVELARACVPADVLAVEQLLGLGK